MSVGVAPRGVALFYLKMQFRSLFVSRFRLTFLELHVPRRYFVSFVPAAALCNHALCHHHSAVFARCLSSTTRSNRTTNISLTACALLLAAVFVPALSIAFYYRRERHKLMKKYEDENVYQTPFVSSKTRSLVQHNGNWFPVVMFPCLRRFEQIRHFTLKDDDILIVSFPKSGNIFVLTIYYVQY